MCCGTAIAGGCRDEAIEDGTGFRAHRRRAAGILPLERARLSVRSRQVALPSGIRAAPDPAHQRKDVHRRPCRQLCAGLAGADRPQPAAQLGQRHRARRVCAQPRHAGAVQGQLRARRDGDVARRSRRSSRCSRMRATASSSMAMRRWSAPMCCARSARSPRCAACCCCSSCSMSWRSRRSDACCRAATTATRRTAPPPIPSSR